MIIRTRLILESTTFEPPDTKLETPFIEAGTLRQELEKLPGPIVSPELLDLIDHLLVVDRTKRRTALEALQHPYLHCLLREGFHLELPSGSFPYCLLHSLHHSVMLFQPRNSAIKILPIQLHL